MSRIFPLLLALALLLPGAAAAHQRLMSAEPAAGASLTAVPDELRLTFNQAVELAFARLRLVGPAGEVALHEPDVPADAPRVLRARIAGPLAPGTYTVQWQVTGADGHPVRDEYRFTIEPGAEGIVAEPAEPAGGGSAAVGPTAPGQPDPPAEHHLQAGGDAAFDAESPLYAAVRWLTFTGLLVAIGAASFALLLLPLLRRRDPGVPDEPVRRARARAAGVGLAASGVLAVALVLRLYAQSVAVHGPGAPLFGEQMGSLLTRTMWGWGWSLQAAATGLALLGFGLAARGLGPGWALAGPAALALAATPALSGHAAATSSAAVVADALHVAAAGGWLGTLLLLVVVGLPALLGGAASRSGTAASLLGAFSPLALLFAAVLTLTGVFAAWLHLGEASALWTTGYGRVLLLKLAVLSVVFATGAYNWLRVKPALERHGDVGPLRRSATVELATGALVLAVTAALVATPPPAHQPPAPADAGAGMPAQPAP